MGREQSASEVLENGGGQIWSALGSIGRDPQNTILVNRSRKGNPSRLRLR